MVEPVWDHIGVSSRHTFGHSVLISTNRAKSWNIGPVPLRPDSSFAVGAIGFSSGFSSRQLSLWRRLMQSF